ncbi:redoxin domain-containing protein [Mucilaginibacter sp. UR6-1]|uniref:redoxin domain-containing protein n=1 Tax=Mucilaginibacter sp. UR6-1 TaxID=1435643 RepID=UPI001E3E6F51|nr:redoxin domain-containing protein [Mucilaginibacter sp. UR6-1]MCC8410095.1 redoxin domain-containing protein [Mucilaginibacter sp. UR6-1]
MNTYTLYDEVALNEARLSLNKQTVSHSALSGNYTDLRLTADSNRWYEYYNGAITHGYIDLKKFNNKPLVIAFYSGKWGDTGLNLLRSLNTIQAEVKANGGNLLVIIPEGEQHLEQIAWLNSLTLSFYVDEQHALAQQLGLYHELLSGWNNEAAQKVLLPAIYVTDARRKVTYRHVYHNTGNSFSAGEVISAVYSSALLVNKKEFI